VLGQNLTVDKIDDLTVYRGGADIHGNGITAVGRVAGLNIDDARLAEIPHGSHQGCRKLEVVFTNHIRYFTDHRQINLQTMLIMFEVQMADQAGDIRQVVLRGGLGQLQVFLLNGGDE